MFSNVLYHYAPFKWLIVEQREHPLSVLTALLWFQFATTLLCVLLYSGDVNFHLKKAKHRIKTVVICFFGVIFAFFLTYFAISEIAIWVLNILGTLASIILSIANKSENGVFGSLLYNSLINYYDKIEEQENYKQQCIRQYEELIRFKL